MFLTITVFVMIGFILFASVFLMFANRHSFVQEYSLAEKELQQALKSMNSQMFQISNSEDDFLKVLNDNTIIKNASHIIISEKEDIYMNKDFANEIDVKVVENLPYESHDVIQSEVVEDGKYLMLAQRTINDQYNLAYYHDLNSMNQYINQLNKYYQISLLVFFTMAMLVSLIIVKFLMKPINNLVNGIERAKNQKSEIELLEETEDEFKSVIQTFNSMNTEIKNHVLDLEDKQKIQEMFLLNFAHEIKTPLTSIIGYAQLMQLKKEEADKDYESLSYIINEGYRLRDISTNLMKLQSTHRAQLNIHRIDVLEIKDDMVLLLNSLHPIQYEIDLEEVVLELDFDLMKMAYRNIIVNCVNAGASKIVIKGKIIEDDYQLSIEDNGRGITETNLNRVFEPFYKSSYGNKSAQSTGLGLYIVKKIIDAHDSTISMQSIVDKKTIVHIIIRGLIYEE